MGLFDRFRRGPKPGTVWTGPSCWSEDYSAVPRPGYYALTDDGKNFRKPLTRLVGVAANDDPEDPTHHLEVAGPNDPPHKVVAGSAVEGQYVDLESTTNGESGVSS